MGTWDYEYLGGVPAAEHSLRRMEGLLAGPLCGWPRDRIMTLPNVPSPADLPDQLITAYADITDVALFYFVGHGQEAPWDELCLGLVRSRPEPSRRAATSLRFTDVRQAMNGSSAAVKIVILDCCFAGMATKGHDLAGLASEVMDLTYGTGAYTMAATGAQDTAWHQDEPGLAKPQTYFTKYLADLVEEGIPGQPARLRLDPLFRQLRGKLAADGRPVPYSRAVNDASKFAFAYNAALQEAQRGPEQELAIVSRQLADAERELTRPKQPDRRPRRRLQVIALASAILAVSVTILWMLTTPATPRVPTPTTSPGTSLPRTPQPSGLIDTLADPSRQGVWEVAFGPRGTTLAADDSHSIYLWDITTRKITATLTAPGNSEGVDPVALGTSGTLAIGSGDYLYPGTYLWDATSKMTTTLTDPGTNFDTALVFGPGGTTLAVGDYNGKTYLWDIRARKPTTTLTDPKSGGVNSVAFGPDGTTLAVADVNGKIYLWDIATRTITTALVDPASEGVDSVAFAPGGTTLAAGDYNGRTYLWNTATRKITATLPDPKNTGVLTVAFGPDDTKLAVLDRNGNLYLWDTTARKIIKIFADPHTRGVSSMAFGPGGTTLAAGDNNGRIYLWRITK